MTQMHRKKPYVQNSKENEHIKWLLGDYVASNGIFHQNQLIVGKDGLWSHKQLDTNEDCWLR